MAGLVVDGVSEYRLANFGFRSDHGKAEDARPCRHTKLGGAGDVARRFYCSASWIAWDREFGTGGGNGSGQLDGSQMTMNIAARADALHNLLAKIAPFVEVKRARLRGLL